MITRNAHADTFRYVRALRVAAIGVLASLAFACNIATSDTTADRQTAADAAKQAKHATGPAAQSVHTTAARNQAAGSATADGPVMPVFETDPAAVLDVLTNDLYFKDIQDTSDFSVQIAVLRFKNTVHDNQQERLLTWSVVRGDYPGVYTIHPDDGSVTVRVDFPQGDSRRLYIGEMRVVAQQLDPDTPYELFFKPSTVQTDGIKLLNAFEAFDIAYFEQRGGLSNTAFPLPYSLANTTYRDSANDWSDPDFFYDFQYSPLVPRHGAQEFQYRKTNDPAPETLRGRWSPQTDNGHVIRASFGENDRVFILATIDEWGTKVLKSIELQNGVVSSHKYYFAGSL